MQGAYGLPVLQLTETVHDGRGVVDAARPAARPRQLVLLRPRPPRATRSSSRTTTSTNHLVDGAQLRGAGASRSRGRGDRAVAAPHLLRAARRRRHGHRRGRVALRRPQPVRARCGSRSPTTRRSGLALRNTPRVVPLIVLGARRAVAARGRRRWPVAGGARAGRAGRGRARGGARVRRVPAGVAARLPLPRRRAARGRSRVLGPGRGRALDARAATAPASSRSPARTSPPTAGATRSSRSRPGSPTARTSRARCSPTARRSRSTCSTRSTAACRTARSSRRRSRAVARLFGIGTVVLRSDLAYERFGLPRPRAFWEELTEPTVAPGLDRAGAVRPDDARTSRRSRWSTRSTLRDASTADPPPVALFGVRDAVPIVHTAPDRPAGGAGG